MPNEATEKSAFPDMFYTQEEVADALKCSKDTLKRMINRGDIPPPKGALKRFLGSELRHVAESGKPWRDLEGSSPLKMAR